MFMLPSSIPPSEVQNTTCNCAEVTNLHQTGQSESTYSVSWSGNTSATSYLLKYVREGDGYTSPEFLTTGNSYTFNSLINGQYTFYVAAVCGQEMSSFIGIEDIIEN